MSRFYEMSVEVAGHDRAKVAEIQAAAEQEWPFGEWWRAGDHDAATMHASGQGSLGGGESEVEFTERLSRAIWCANGRYCRISVSATCLEDLPYESYELDELDYARLIEGKHDLNHREAGRGWSQVVDPGSSVEHHWILYNANTGTLLTTRVYGSFDEAAQDASQVDDILVLPLTWERLDVQQIRPADA